MPTGTITWGLRYDIVGSDPPNGAAATQRLAEDADAVFTTINNKVVALENSRPKLLSRARRITASSASTGSTVGVLRLNTAVVSGRMYLPQFYCHPTSSVTTDNIEVGLRFDLAGNADASDPILPGARGFGLFGQPRSFECVPWVATATGTLSLCIYVRRDTGSGSVTLYADSTERFTDLLLWEIVSGPVASGTDL